jgi:hypothetical protein
MVTSALPSLCWHPRDAGCCGLSAERDRPVIDLHISGNQCFAKVTVQGKMYFKSVTQYLEWKQAG